MPLRCEKANVGMKVYEPDGEAWECKYDPTAEDYFWEPIAPNATPEDSVGWKNQYWKAPDGATFRITTRNEWINHIFLGGSDVFFRKPVTKPLELEPGKVAFYQRVYTWNGTAWSECKNSGGWLTWGGGKKATGMVDTLNWGRAACGAAWYDTNTWIEVWKASTSTWDESPAVDPTPNGKNAGYAPYGKNGQVWDAPPGWTGSVPSAPDNPPVALPPMPSLLPPSSLTPPLALSATPVTVAR